MSRFSTPAITLALVCAALAGIAPAEAQEPTDKQAQEVANRAISDLAAWRNQSARTYLEKQKGRFGSTPQYQTAWALLEIQEGGSGDTTKSARGTADLAKLSKNQKVDSVAAYYNGEFLYEMNKRTEAAAAWQAATQSAGATVKENPYDATAQFYLGAALVRSKKYEQARTALLLAVRGGFDPAMVNHQIGLSYLFAESWSEAKEAFDLGLSVDPRFAPMYFWRAMAWDKLNRKDQMLIDLDQYVRLAPDGPYAGKARAVLKSAGR